MIDKVLGIFNEVLWLFVSTIFKTFISCCLYWTLLWAETFISWRNRLFLRYSFYFSMLIEHCLYFSFIKTALNIKLFYRWCSTRFCNYWGHSKFGSWSTIVQARICRFLYLIIPILFKKSCFAMFTRRKLINVGSIRLRIF